MQNPAAHQSICMRVDLQPRAAAVRHFADRLGQQQAAVGSGRKQPPAAAFLHQVLEVLGWLKAQQRKLEAVLAAGLAVAAAAVAAQLGEDRHDLIGKVDRRLVAKVGDRGLDRSGRSGGTGGRDRGRAIGLRHDQPGAVNPDHARGRDLVRCAAAQIAQLTAGVLAGDDQLLPGVLAVERETAVDVAAAVDRDFLEHARVAQSGRFGGGGSQCGFGLGRGWVGSQEAGHRPRSQCQNECSNHRAGSRRAIRLFMMHLPSWKASLVLAPVLAWRTVRRGLEMLQARPSQQVAKPLRGFVWRAGYINR